LLFTKKLYEIISTLHLDYTVPEDGYRKLLRNTENNLEIPRRHI